MKYLISFGLIIGGFLLVRFFKWIIDHTMRFSSFENILGPGGSYSAAKLFGVLAIAAGIVILFSNWNF